jgi:hypothetical protein
LTAAGEDQPVSLIGVRPVLEPPLTLKLVSLLNCWVNCLACRSSCHGL